MTDDRTALDVRLHESFHREGLPPAPHALLDALDHVAEASATRPIVRRSGRLPWSAIGIAAMLAVGGGLALMSFGGSQPIRPALSASPSAPAAPIRITYQPMWTAEVPEDRAGLLRIAAVLRLRLGAIGIGDATAQVEGASVVVELPADADSDAVRRYIGQTGRLVLAPLGETVVSRGMPLDESRYPALCDSTHIADADVAPDQNGNPALHLKLDDAGTRLFADYTRSHVGSSVAIAIDGVVVVAPMIQNEIPGGDIEVSIGPKESISAEALSRLAAIIRIGPLPVPILEVAAGVGPPEPVQTPRLASPSPASLDPAAPLPSDIAAITTCDDLPPRTDGPYLTCEAAVASALAVLPAGAPPPVAIAFVHTCNDVVAIPAAADCYVHAMGLVTLSLADGSDRRIWVGVGTAPVLLPPSNPAPS